MTDLTIQWKKGELKEFYGKPFYIKKQSGVVKIDYLCKYGFVNNYDVVEVLAPIPSYKEWQEKLDENQQLKEFLSKCLDELAEFNNSHYPETQELFSQITNAIGEK